MQKEKWVDSIAIKYSLEEEEKKYLHTILQLLHTFDNVQMIDLANCLHQDTGKVLLEAGSYDAALSAYVTFYEYSGITSQAALDMAKENIYRKAAALEANGLQDKALETYELISDYKDSLQKQQSIHMEKGYSALQAMDLKTARDEFIACGSLDEATSQIHSLDVYERACDALSKKNYSVAKAGFMSLGDYLDSSDQLHVCNVAEYNTAAENYSKGKIADAYALFVDLGDFSDSKTRVKEIVDSYDAAIDLFDAGKYDEAIGASPSGLGGSACERFHTSGTSRISVSV